MKDDISKASIKIESGSIWVDKDGSRSTSIRIKCNNQNVSEYIYNKILSLMETIYPFKLVYNHKEVKKDTFVRFISDIKYDIVQLSTNFDNSNKEYYSISFLVNPATTAIDKNLLSAWIDAIVATVALDEK